MIIVIARLTVKPDKKQELFGFAQALIAATRQEAGCISYTLLEDPFDAAKCAFVEEWENKQALERHFTTPHMKQWRQESADLLADKTEITLYQGEETNL